MSETLWCIRIPGPDDVYAMPSKEVAEQRKIEHDGVITEWYAKYSGDMKYLPALENMLAVVEPYPWSAKNHAEGLGDWLGA